MRKVFPILLALTLLGCATTKYPPPIIKDGYYLNPEYQFSVKVPEGWQVSHEIPDSFKQIFLAYEEKSIPVLFLNTRTGGLIYIHVQKTNLGGSRPSASLYSMATEEIYLELHKQQEALKGTPSVLDYSFDIGHECEFTETLLIQEQDSLNILKQINTGSCYHAKNHFYFAVLTLMSWSHTFEENYEVYKEFIEHFRIGNLMHGKDEVEK
jgi:hypothetical protein